MEGEMKPLFRILTICVVIIFIGSCAPVYNVHKGPARDNDFNIDTNATAYVALSEDHTSSGHLYSGSGKEVASEIEFLLFNHFNNVIVANNVEEFDKALETANQKGCDYLIFPNLIKWDDYATEWSGIPDRLKLKISIVDVNTEKVLDKILIEGKGKIMSWGGDHPMDIAKEPIKTWIDSLFK
jgi:hypothetical protein